MVSKRFQFSLRTALIALPLIGIVVGLLGRGSYKAREEQQAARALGELGAIIDYDSDGYPVIIQVTDQRLINEDGLAVLKRFSRLDRIVLTGDVQLRPEDYEFLRSSNAAVSDGWWLLRADP